MWSPIEKSPLPRIKRQTGRLSSQRRLYLFLRVPFIYTVTARADDDVIEGAEDPDRAFYLGVQFHAEALPPIDSYYLRLFSAFVEAAANFSGR